MNARYCPKDGLPLTPYISFLAPTYETYICDSCGGIWYDLVDKEQLEQIRASIIQNAKARLKGTDIVKQLLHD